MAGVVTEERLFPWRKVCDSDFERDGGRCSECGDSAEGGGCVLGDGLTYGGGGDAKGD
jgi:hypothetical protein